MGVINVVDVSLLLDGLNGSTEKNVDPDPIEIRCDDPAKLFFTISSDDAVQFSIYSTDPTVKKTTALQTIVSKKAAGKEKYTASAAGLLLEAGSYFVTVKLTGRSNESNYTLGLDEVQTVFYDKADDGSNNYLYNAKTKEINAAVVYGTATWIDEVTDAVIVDLTEQGFVGFGDAADYRQFTPGSAAKLSFDVEATDAVKFTVVSLTESLDKKGNTVYTQKALQTSTAKLNKATGKYAVTTAGLLIAEPDPNVSYYLAVESTNAAKGGNAIYTVKVNGDSRFYTLGDDNSNNWLYDTKTKTVNNAVYWDATWIDEVTDAVVVDQTAQGFVGYEDTTDYRQFTLGSAAKLSFGVEATDAVKFTVVSLTESLDKKGNTVYTQKALQTSTAKLNKATGKYEVTTAGLLIAEPDPNVSYYLAVESTNAAKGGYAIYTVEVSDASRFYILGDDGENNWLYDTKTKTVNDAVYGDATWIDEHTDAVVVDQTAQGFVGFGDAADYRQIELSCPAKLSFEVEATDAVKFTVISLTESQDKKGNTVYTQKALQTSTAKLNKATGKYEVTTAGLLIAEPDPNVSYYLAVESTNAAKGGYADYTVGVNDASCFYTKGFNDDDTWEDAGFFGEIPSDPEAEIRLEDGWVGFGDTVDFKSFTVAEDMSVNFSIDASGPVKFTVYRLTNGKLTSLQSTTVKANVGTTTKALALEADKEYYFAVESTDAAKGGSADFTVTGCRYAAPLNVTLGKRTDDWDAAVLDVPAGTSAADKITFGANTKTWFTGTLELKGGNDEIVLAKSSEEVLLVAERIDTGDGDDKLTLNAGALIACKNLDFGAGNDTLTVGADAGWCFEDTPYEEMYWTDEAAVIDFGEGNNTLTLQRSGEIDEALLEIRFGAGNDVLTVGIDGDLEEIKTLNFGDGNNTMTVEAGGEVGIKKEGLMFGGGDDTLVVKANSEFSTGLLDFGDGNDTLVLDGWMQLFDNERGLLPGLENVSGKGTLLLSHFSDIEEDARFAGTGIEIVNLLDCDEDLTDNWRKQDSDDTRATAVAMSWDAEDGEYEDFSFWLCGQEVADSVVYGCADEVDWIKFTKQAGCPWMNLSVDGDAPVTFRMYDKNGKKVWEEDVANCASYDLRDLNLKNGSVYYLELSMASDGYAGGQVEIEDHRDCWV